jgi:hypothetical protein
MGYFNEIENHSFYGEFLYGIQDNVSLQRFGKFPLKPNTVLYSYNTMSLERISVELDKIEQWLYDKGIRINKLGLNNLRKPEALLSYRMNKKDLEPLYILISKKRNKEVLSQLADYVVGIQIEWGIKKHSVILLECEL